LTESLDSISLQEAITARRREISTDSYPMSIGELTNLYRDDELDVHPEFQRIYRWTDEQKSHLIESILLGIPLPSVFVSQTEGGTWDVVDGVQRISTILEFQGLLVDDEGEKFPPLKLTKTRYLPQLEGVVWESRDGQETSLTQAQRLDIRRAKVDLKIIKRESSEAAKYDLFQRLNSYGTTLTRQELRSCLIISNDRQFYYWLDSLRSHEGFRETVALANRLNSEQYDLELVLRFLIFRTLDLDSIRSVGNIGEFLDQKSVEFASAGIDLDAEGSRFRQTFDILSTFGDDVFRKYNQEKERFQGSFLNTAYEVVALGLGFHIDYYADHPDQSNALERAKEFWQDRTFGPGFSTGMRADTRMTRTIPKGRELFQPPA
jgi:Protein of unknown function DUF262